MIAPAQWVALVMYVECGNCSVAGKLAVGTVVMNRAKGNWGRVAKEVWHKAAFTGLGAKRREGLFHQERLAPGDLKSWLECKKLARRVRVGLRGATHYYWLGASKPKWAKDRHFRWVATIDGHAFYKQKAT